MPAKTIISFTLDKASIDNAIWQLQTFRDDFMRKVDRLRDLIAEKISEKADNGFKNAIVSDVIFGEEQENDVTVEWNSSENNVSVVLVKGSKALFIEFGAGVKHNMHVLGSSLHPWVLDGTFPNYKIGMYGKGHGRYEAWGFYRDGTRDTLTVTRGTPAAMPLYKAVWAIIDEMDKLVQEVFG